MAKREKLEGRELDERDLRICEMIDDRAFNAEIIDETGATLDEVLALREALKAEDAGK